MDPRHTPKGKRIHSRRRDPTTASSAPYSHFQGGRVTSPNRPQSTHGDGSRSLGFPTEPPAGILLQWGCWSCMGRQRGKHQTAGSKQPSLPTTSVVTSTSPKYTERTPLGTISNNSSDNADRPSMMTKKYHLHPKWMTMNPSLPTLARDRFQVRFTNWPHSSTTLAVTGNPMQRSLRSLRPRR